jgi:hypothetical protein
MFSIPPLLLLMLDYRLLSMLFNFVGGCGSVCQVALLDYVPREWEGELCMMCGTPLFILETHTSSFETSW